MNGQTEGLRRIDERKEFFYMRQTARSYMIDAQAVDEISASVGKYLEANQVGREVSVRIRLCVEEVLLAIADQFGDGQQAELILAKRLGRPYIALRYKGGRFDPTEGGMEDEISELVLTSLGINPTYSFHSGVNKVTFSPPGTGVRQEVVLGIAVVLSVILGLMKGAVPEGVRDVLLEYLLTPVSDAFMKLLMLVAPVLIFLSIITSICKSASGAEFGRMSRYTIGRFVLMTALSSAVFSGLLIVFFHFHYGDGTGKGMGEGFKELYDMLLDIIPGNLVLPFSEGNMMQIIFLALLFGGIILGLDDKADRLKGVLTDANSVFSAVMELVCRIIPVFIFTSLLKLFWENGLSTFAGLWRPVMVGIAGEAALCVIQIFIVSGRFKVTPALLMKKIREPFIVAVTTGSSMAAYTKGVEAGRKKLGMRAKYADIAYPLAISLYDANYIPLFVVMPYYLAEVYHVPVSPAWFIKAALIILLSTYASPQVSGGAMVCLTILFAQLGIPAQGLGLAGVIATILDFPSTAAKVTGQLMEMTVQAGHLDMLDVNILRNRDTH